MIVLDTHTWVWWVHGDGCPLVTLDDKIINYSHVATIR